MKRKEIERSLNALSKSRNYHQNNELDIDNFLSTLETEQISNELKYSQSENDYGEIYYDNVGNNYVVDSKATELAYKAKLAGILDASLSNKEDYHDDTANLNSILSVEIDDYDNNDLSSMDNGHDNESKRPITTKESSTGSDNVSSNEMLQLMMQSRKKKKKKKKS